MENETIGNEQRQRDIAALLARGLSRAARTSEQTESTGGTVVAESQEVGSTMTEGGDQ
ncbi:hypothetical protein LF1_08350 [Rubripirellula obstinata]|uniref:Uncharacterized protein n=1 Tax=Rubripirellula obstinata TaxID=406547 RepID=A0A5B1CEZ5_9BACT|nr:hypothetical protein [Rubripirellula obstinata]KAA1258319.1 hypothetical protein LF1_08350 [Rubripirellula obstinata]